MPGTHPNQPAIRSGHAGDQRGSGRFVRPCAAIAAFVWMLLVPPCTMAEVSRAEAIRIASEVPLIKDGMRGVDPWQASVTPPSGASGEWAIAFHAPDDPKPLLGARVDARSGEVLGVWWDQEAFRLSKKPEARLWSADQLMAAQAESPTEVQDAVGDFLREYLQRHRKAQMRVEYLPRRRPLARDRARRQRYPGLRHVCRRPDSGRASSRIQLDAAEGRSAGVQRGRPCAALQQHRWHWAWP